MYTILHQKQDKQKHLAMGSVSIDDYRGIAPAPSPCHAQQISEKKKT